VGFSLCVFYYVKKEIVFISFFFLTSECSECTTWIKCHLKQGDMKWLWTFSLPWVGRIALPLLLHHHSPVQLLVGHSNLLFSEWFSTKKVSGPSITTEKVVCVKYVSLNSLLILSQYFSSLISMTLLVFFQRHW
jgi:hypothetical protein